MSSCFASTCDSAIAQHVSLAMQCAVLYTSPAATSCAHIRCMLCLLASSHATAAACITQHFCNNSWPHVTQPPRLPLTDIVSSNSTSHCNVHLCDQLHSFMLPICISPLSVCYIQSQVSPCMKSYDGTQHTNKISVAAYLETRLYCPQTFFYLGSNVGLTFLSYNRRFGMEKSCWQCRA